MQGRPTQRTLVGTRNFGKLPVAVTQLEDTRVWNAWALRVHRATVKVDNQIGKLKVTPSARRLQLLGRALV